MRKTVLLLALTALGSGLCHADEYDATYPDTPITDFGAELTVPAPDYEEHIEALPQEVTPSFADPAFQLFIEDVEKDWNHDSFHFNYLLEEDSTLA